MWRMQTTENEGSSLQVTNLPPRKLIIYSAPVVIRARRVQREEAHVYTMQAPIREGKSQISAMCKTWQKRN